MSDYKYRVCVEDIYTYGYGIGGKEIFKANTIKECRKWVADNMDQILSDHNCSFIYIQEQSGWKTICYVRQGDKLDYGN